MEQVPLPLMAPWRWRSGKAKRSSGRTARRPDVAHASNGDSSTQARQSLLPAEFTLKFRRLDEAGDCWEVDYGAGTVIDEDWGALKHAFNKALVEVRRVADAGRECQRVARRGQGLAQHPHSLARSISADGG